MASDLENVTRPSTAGSDSTKHGKDADEEKRTVGALAVPQDEKCDGEGESAIPEDRKVRR